MLVQVSTMLTEHVSNIGSTSRTYCMWIIYFTADTNVQPFLELLTITLDQDTTILLYTLPDVVLECLYHHPS